MVDAINGTGVPQNNPNTNRTQNVSNNERSSTRADETQTAPSNEPVDRVEISPEARELSRQQPENQARRDSEDARRQLENNQDVTLGLNPAFDQQES